MFFLCFDVCFEKNDEKVEYKKEKETKWLKIKIKFCRCGSWFSLLCDEQCGSEQKIDFRVEEEKRIRLWLNQRISPSKSPKEIRM